MASENGNSELPELAKCDLHNWGVSKRQQSPIHFRRQQKRITIQRDARSSTGEMASEAGNGKVLHNSAISTLLENTNCIFKLQYLKINHRAQKAVLRSVGSDRRVSPEYVKYESGGQSH